MAKTKRDTILFRVLVVAPISIAVLSVAAFVVCAIIFAPAHDDSKPYNLRHMQQATFGCLSKDKLKGIIKMAAEGDNEGASAAVDQEVGEGECREFQNGEKVYFEKFDWGLAQVRPQGEMSPYWVTTESVSN